jgi:hypothetical protein
MLKIIHGLPDNVVGVSAEGTVTRHDYDSVLLPFIEGKLRTHDKLRMLYVLGAGLDRFTSGAFWADARGAIRHYTTFERVAVVTDERWIVNATKFFSHFMPCPMNVFSNDRMSQAKEWISE